MRPTEPPRLLPKIKVLCTFTDLIGIKVVSVSNRSGNVPIFNLDVVLIHFNIFWSICFIG